MLGQLCPTTTSNELLYNSQPEESINGLVILIVNNTAGAIAARAFVDPDGNTADTTTAVAYDKSVPANDSVEVIVRGQVDFVNGSVWVRSATASALTFHLMRLVV